MIAWKDEHPLGERRIPLHRIEELRPFGCDTGVGHVATDQHDIQRPLLMNGFEALEDTGETIIAAPPAFDAKSVALAHQMNVGKVRDAPGRSAGSRVVVAEIDRLVHERVGKAPDQRRGG